MPSAPAAMLPRLYLIQILSTSPQALLRAPLLASHPEHGSDSCAQSRIMPNRVASYHSRFTYCDITEIVLCDSPCPGCLSIRYTLRRTALPSLRSARFARSL